MRVMAIIKGTEEWESGTASDERLVTAMGQYNEVLVKAGILLAGAGLHTSAKGARVRFTAGTRTVTDGPFSLTTELVAGFWLWQVKSIDEAIEWAKRCPQPMPGPEAEIEIRQVFEPEDVIVPAAWS